MKTFELNYGIKSNASILFEATEKISSSQLAGKHDDIFNKIAIFASANLSFDC